MIFLSKEIFVAGTKAREGWFVKVQETSNVKWSKKFAV